MNTLHKTDNLIIHHKVKDYAAWRASYDTGEKEPSFGGRYERKSIPQRR